MAEAAGPPAASGGQAGPDRAATPRGRHSPAHRHPHGIQGFGPGAGAGAGAGSAAPDGAPAPGQSPAGAARARWPIAPATAAGHLGRPAGEPHPRGSDRLRPQRRAAALAGGGNLGVRGAARHPAGGGGRRERGSPTDHPAPGLAEVAGLSPARRGRPAAEGDPSRSGRAAAGSAQPRSHPVAGLRWRGLYRGGSHPGHPGWNLASGNPAGTGSGTGAGGRTAALHHPPAR